jgi:hypothetical protein
VWFWFLYGVGALVATGVFADATESQQRTGTALATIAAVAPGVSGLVLSQRLHRPPWRTASAIILVAAPLAGASVYWWDSWFFF